jgi:hypothetical protein
MLKNTRYWAQENPRVNIPTRTRYPQKIHIIKGNLNSANYLDLLLANVGTAL